MLLRLRSIYPRCMVVPFGSSITGLGVLSSDCDLAFFSNPPMSLVNLLTQEKYFSASSLATIIELERKHQVKYIPPDSSKDGKGLLGKPSHHNNPHILTFNTVTSVIRKHKKLSYVMPIPHARCPIIKFVHNKTGLHCDICVNA